MPELSVLMPVRNGMPYVREAVRSTLRALPRDGELAVLVDGGSDATAAWLESLREPRLRLIVRAESQGITASLNALLDGTDSAYVARMDADDVCLPWRFRVQRAAVAHHDFAFSSIVFVDGRTRVSGVQIPGRISAAAAPLHLLLGNTFVHPTMFARRASVERLGGYRETTAEDYDLWLRAQEHGMTTVRTALPALLYRRHGTQVTAESPWAAPGAGAVLDESYGAVARQVLGMTGDTTALRLAAAVGDFGPVPPETRARFRQLLQARAARLGWTDRLQLRTRIRAQL